jgi:hypothetical protein
MDKTKHSPDCVCAWCEVERQGTMGKTKHLRGQIDSHGWWKPPSTECCGRMFVLFDCSIGKYREWNGFEKDEIPRKLQCERCGKVSITPRPEQ